MRTNPVLLILSLFAVLALAGIGCSPGAPPPSDTTQTPVPPPPSPVPPSPEKPTQAPVAPPVLPSQTPTSPAPVPAAPAVVAKPVNLLTNGSFVQWDEGQVAPRHWTIGYGFARDAMPYELEPLEDPKYDDGHAVRETWKENDTMFGFGKVFGQTIGDLKPNTTYRLDIVAHNESENPVIVSAFEMKGFEPGRVASGTPGERLDLVVTEITPSPDLGTYKGTFTTQKLGAVKLGARIEGKNPSLPGSVVWDSWTLTEIK